MCPAQIWCLLLPSHCLETSERQNAGPWCLRLAAHRKNRYSPCFHLLLSPCDISGCSDGSMNLQGLAPAEPARHGCIIHSSSSRMCRQRQHPALVFPWVMLETCVPAWPGSAGDTEHQSVPHSRHCSPGQRFWDEDGHTGDTQMGQIPLCPEDTNIPSSDATQGTITPGVSS